MTALGDLLEAMVSAHRSFATFTGTLHEYVNRSHDLKSSSLGQGWPNGDDDDHPARSFESETRITLAPPRAHIEAVGDLVRQTTAILDGERAYFDAPGWGARIDDQAPDHLERALGPAIHLFAPSSLISPLDLAAPVVTDLAGRAVWHVNARPRWPLPWPFGGVDTHELFVDCERGTVLRLLGLVGKHEARRAELLDVVYDAPVDLEAFELPALACETSGLALTEASTLVPFRLWALPMVAEDITYRPHDPESVTFQYDGILLVETRANSLFVATAAPEQATAGRWQVLVTDQWLGTSDHLTQIEIHAPGAGKTRLLELAALLTPVE